MSVPRPAARHPAPFVLLAGVGGLLAALGSRMQGSLSAAVDDPFLAAFLSAVFPLVITGAAMAFAPRARAGLRRVWAQARARTGSLRWWHCLGGLAGAGFAITQGATVSALGVATFIVAIVAGNSIGSLFVDARGIAPGGRRPITPARTAGPVLAVAAALFAVLAQGVDVTALWLAAAPLAVGFLQAVQQGFNGHVRAVASGGTPGQTSVPAGVVATTFQNFCFGVGGIAVAFGVATALRGGLPSTPLPGNPALYLGGVLAVGTAAISVTVVHRIGVLQLMLGTIAGQMLGALAIDVVTGQAVTAVTFASAALTLVAVALPMLPSRPSRTRRSDVTSARRDLGRPSPPVEARRDAVAAAAVPVAAASGDR